MPTITFINEDKSILADSGATILEAARNIGITIEAPCNGMGTCGKCKVKVGDEYVLACQTKITDDLEVLTESKEHENRTLKILSSGKSFSYPLAPYVAKQFDGGKTNIYIGGAIAGLEAGDTLAWLYGLVVDIGTTTLVTSIVDLQTGEELATESRLNPQSAYAQDVLSRIHFASEPEGLETMQSSLLAAVNEMIADMAQKAHITSKHIYETVYSGNTAMLHLACGKNPEPLGKYPYVSQIQGGEYIPAEGLDISPFGVIYLPPIISGFVGPDITSGILASKLYEQKETVLFIDIGTNGEMALARNGALAATSTAAGPAFEGMNISCGMRAGNGAIERFAIDENGKASFDVIGGGAATGICGSGLLDIAGELVRTGIVGKTGRFAAHGNDAIVEIDGKKAYRITDSVYFSQNDVRQVQLAKGAIRSGVESLLKRLNVSIGDVDRVEIAGSFGYHLNEKSLVEIGLLPSEVAGKITFVGNTAQSGGVAFLLNKDFRDELRSVVSGISTIELADDKDFEKLFVASLGF